jgi:hypothetical protein
MKLSSILRILGACVMVLAVFGLITTWAVSFTTNIDITFWLYPAGFLVLGGVLMGVSRVFNR